MEIKKAYKNKLGILDSAELVHEEEKISRQNLPYMVVNCKKQYKCTELEMIWHYNKENEWKRRCWTCLVQFKLGYILYECSKERNICRNIEIFNGTYRYKCHFKRVYTS